MSQTSNQRNITNDGQYSEDEEWADIRSSEDEEVVLKNKNMPTKNFERNKINKFPVKKSILAVMDRLKLFSKDASRADELIKDLQAVDGLFFFGLDLMVEIREELSCLFNDCEYYCELCKRTFPAQSLVAHIGKFEHILAFVKALFPNLYEKISLLHEVKREAELKRYYQRMRSVVPAISMPVVTGEYKVEVKSLLQMKIDLLPHLSYYNIIQKEPLSLGLNEKSKNSIEADEMISEVVNSFARMPTNEPRKSWKTVKVLFIRKSYLMGNGFEENEISGHLPDITIMNVQDDSFLTDRNFFKAHPLEDFDILLLSPFDWICDTKNFAFLGVEKSYICENLNADYYKKCQIKMESTFEKVKELDDELNKMYPDLQVIWTLPHQIDYSKVDMRNRGMKTDFIGSYKARITIRQYCEILMLMRKWYQELYKLRMVPMCDVVMYDCSHRSLLNYKGDLAFRGVIDGARVGLGWTRSMDMRFWDAVQGMWRLSADQVREEHIKCRSLPVMKDTFVDTKKIEGFRSKYISFCQRRNEELIDLGIECGHYRWNEEYGVLYHITMERQKEEREINPRGNHTNASVFKRSDHLNGEKYAHNHHQNGVNFNKHVNKPLLPTPNDCSWTNYEEWIREKYGGQHHERNRVANPLENHQPGYVYKPNNHNARVPSNITRKFDWEHDIRETIPLPRNLHNNPMKCNDPRTFNSSWQPTSSLDRSSYGRIPFESVEGIFPKTSMGGFKSSMSYSPVCAISIICDAIGDEIYLGCTLKALFKEASMLESKKVNPMFLFENEDHIYLIEKCMRKLKRISIDSHSRHNQFAIQPPVKACKRLLIEIKRYNDVMYANDAN